MVFIWNQLVCNRNQRSNFGIGIGAEIFFLFRSYTRTDPIACRDLSLQPASMMDAYILVATIVFGLLSRPLQADVPRCDKDSPDFTKSPYCLPHTYNKDLIPPTEGPLHINVDIFVFEVLSFTFLFTKSLSN